MRGDLFDDETVLVNKKTKCIAIVLTGSGQTAVLSIKQLEAFPEKKNEN